MSGANTRVIAAHVLDAVLHRGRSLKAELGSALPKLPDPRDRALVEAAVMAALREHGRYADTLAQWMSRPPGARDGLLRSLIYIGLAQLDAMKLPAHPAAWGVANCSVSTSACRRMPRSMRRSKPRACLAVRIRQVWSMHCCDAHCASHYRQRAWMLHGRNGWRIASAMHGPMMPTKSSLPAANRRRCGCA